MSLASLIDSGIAEGIRDADALAAHVVDKAKVPAKWADFFGSILLDECRRSLRAHALRLERSINLVNLGGQNACDTQYECAAEVDDTTDRKAWLAARFTVGGGRWVTWGDATIADHEARIQFLDRYRSGIDRTIGRHSAAVDLLKSTQADTLGDLDADALADLDNESEAA